MFHSTKTFEHAFSCAFRQHKAKSHCRFIHGYALSVRMEFEASELENGWVVDFGGLGSFKQQLEDFFDHKLIVASNDPYCDDLWDLENKGLVEISIVEATGCEAFAKLIFEMLEDWLIDNEYGSRVRVRSVEVFEHAGNSAIHHREET